MVVCTHLCFQVCLRVSEIRCVCVYDARTHTLAKALAQLNVCRYAALTSESQHCTDPCPLD